MSEAYPSNSEPLPTEAGAEQPFERPIHPDTLKFMGMAKDLLDSPAVKHSITTEQQKQHTELTESQLHAVNAAGPEADRSQSNAQASHSLEEQPDTLNFMNMAKELLDSPAVKQAKEGEQHNQ